MKLKKFLAMVTLVSACATFRPSHTGSPPRVDKTNVCQSSELSLDDMVAAYGKDFTDTELDKIRMIKAMDHYIKTEYGLDDGDAFCKVIGHQKRRWSFVATRKDEFNSNNDPVHIDERGTKEAIEKKIEKIDKDKYDVYKYEVFNPDSQISEGILDNSHTSIAYVFFHERWHSEVDHKRIIEEGMADITGRLLSIEFFKSSEKWKDHQKKAEDGLEYDLKRSRVIVKAYDDLQEIFENDSYDKERKRELADEVYKTVKDELGDSVVNNATISREIYYVKNFTKMYVIHQSYGNDLKKTIKFLKGLPEKHSIASARLETEYLRAKAQLRKEAEKNLENAEKCYED